MVQKSLPGQSLSRPRGFTGTAAIASSSTSDGANECLDQPPADASTRRGPTRGATLSSSASQRRAVSRRMRHPRRARIVQSMPMTTTTKTASKEEDSHRPFRRGSSIAADDGDDPLPNRREFPRDDGTTRNATSANAAADLSFCTLTMSSSCPN